MKFSSLKHKFRTAVLTGAAAFGMMTSCQQPVAADKKPVPVTQLVFPADSTGFNGLIPGITDFPLRQYSRLEDQSTAIFYFKWLSPLDAAKSKTLLQQADIVNDFVNARVSYVNDSLAPHDTIANYFQSGVETALTGMGDCEDFAIAKFYALQYLAVPASRYGILAVSATDPESNPNHAVLVVDTSAANNWINPVVLDDAAGLKHTLRTLGETGYTPKMMLDELTNKVCHQKQLKAPSP